MRFYFKFTLLVHVSFFNKATKLCIQLFCCFKLRIEKKNDLKLMNKLELVIHTFRYTRLVAQTPKLFLLLFIFFAVC